VTRAYRTNLNMLALVALWTGAFLVFSTQSLSVLRRRRSFGLLRALGVTRGQLQRALLGEGAALGTLGGLLGVTLGAVARHHCAAVPGCRDLGNGQLHVQSAPPCRPALDAGRILLIGHRWSRASGRGCRRARLRARRRRARLKGGDGDHAGAVRSALARRLALLIGGALLAWLPPVRGLPLFGYLAIAALLFGAVLLVPMLTVKVLRAAPRSGRVVFDTAVAQLRDNVGLSTLEPGLDHRELQPDGGNGHHGLLLPRVLRALARQAAAGRHAAARPATATIPRSGRRPIRPGSPASRAWSASEFRRTRPLLLDPRGRRSR
jgi:putative ABC transport system permease protein